MFLFVWTQRTRDNKVIDVSSEMLRYVTKLEEMAVALKYKTNVRKI